MTLISASSLTTTAIAPISATSYPVITFCPQYGDFYYYITSSSFNLEYYITARASTNATDKRTYSTGLATFTTAVGGWEIHTRSEYLLDSGEIFTACLETVNIYFDKEAMKSNQIEVFLNSMTSLARLRVTYASDSNYIFTTASSAADTYAQGANEETGYLDNTSIYYRGTKQIMVNKIMEDSRDAQSIKFKVDAVLLDDYTYYDEYKINGIHILPNEVVFLGGEDNA